MTDQGIRQINIRQVLKQKAPSIANKIPSFLVDYLIRLVHQDELNDILTRYHEKQGVEFTEALIDYFNLTLEVKNEHHIPEQGRFIFTSNHPLGGLDGICLSTLIGRRFNGNIRYLVNDLLLYIPNLQSIFVPVNKHGAQGRNNTQVINEAYASEHQIITFPAGLCSRKQNGKIQDTEWKKSFIQKAVEYKRDIIPIYFDGQNSNFFYRLANLRKAFKIKMNYEMVYLPDEMFRCKNSTFKIHFGQPIPWQTFDKSKKPSEWAEWVKESVYNLSNE